MTTPRFARNLANPRSNVVRRLRAEVVARMAMLEGGNAKQRDAHAHGVTIADRRALESEASAEPFASHSLSWWKVAESAAAEFLNRMKDAAQLPLGTVTFIATIITDESGLMGELSEISIEAGDTFDVVSRGFGKANAGRRPTATAAAIAGQVSRMGFRVIDWHDDERISVTPLADIVAYGFTVIRPV